MAEGACGTVLQCAAMLEHEMLQTGSVTYDGTTVDNDARGDYPSCCCLLLPAFACCCLLMPAAAAACCCLLLLLLLLLIADA